MQILVCQHCRTRVTNEKAGEQETREAGMGARHRVISDLT